MIEKRARSRLGLIAGTVAAPLVAGICARLGIWQLDRRVERLERNHLVEERISQPILTLSAVPEDTTGLGYRMVEFVGEYDAGAGVVLAGRSYQGATGTHLLVPLLLADGGAVMVHRGWVPALDASTVDPAAHTPVGEQRVRGLIMSFPEIRTTSDGGADAISGSGRGREFKRLWYRMDFERWRQQSPYLLAPVYLQEVAGEPGSAGIPAILPHPELDEGPHMGYALQWFSFGAVALVGWLILILRRPAAPRVLPPLGEERETVAR